MRCSHVTNSPPRYPPLEPFTHVEHGRDADPSLQDLLRGASSVNDITPNIGAEIRGVQISSLSDTGKDQLALFTAQKKVVGQYNPSSIPHRQQADRCIPSVSRSRLRRPTYQ